MRHGYQIQVPAFPPMVKKLIIINMVLWIGLVIIIQNFLMSQPYFFRWFGLVPSDVLTSFWVWQVFTYMFLHSENVFHVVFNMLILWFLGSELEYLWGRRFFLFYYLASGIGAGLIYLFTITLYYLFTGNFAPLTFPVIGASGAIFGIILAYGILFGERIIYFFMIFPMKAKYFVMILGTIEVLNLLNTGFSGRVANLAHLGGLISGFLVLRFWPRIRDWIVKKQTQSRGRKLKLVVDNDKHPPKGPKYWN